MVTVRRRSTQSCDVCHHVWRSRPSERDPAVLFLAHSDTLLNRGGRTISVPPDLSSGRIRVFASLAFALMASRRSADQRERWPPARIRSKGGRARRGGEATCALSSAVPPKIFPILRDSSSRTAAPDSDLRSRARGLKSERGQSGPAQPIQPTSRRLRVQSRAARQVPIFVTFTLVSVGLPSGPMPVQCAVSERTSRRPRSTPATARARPKQSGSSGQ